MEEKREKKKQTLVFYPSPAIGHLISMVELGKRFLALPNSPFSTITILITEAPYNTGSTTPYIRCISASHPSIHFHHLPFIPLSSLQSPPCSNIETLALRLLRLNIPNVLEALNTISLSFSISAFIFDFFCASSIEAATHLGIPCYCFFTSGAQVLATFLYFPILHRNHDTTGFSFNRLPSTYLLNPPGVAPFPGNHMPFPMRDPKEEAYHCFLHATANLVKTSGIIVNTFEALEPRAVKTIREGSCVPHAPTPPIYCIGPLIATEGGDGDGPRDECLVWLDSQPRQSVVFLCFGSLGVFSKAQLKEIAVGLERSGQRFMWVVRSPPPTGTEEEEEEEEDDGRSNRFRAPPEPDLDALLPEGFLERTKERGMVVKSWAPQLAVLKHESVGGFVTHCGWNSVLEAVCAGVPMVAWPLYAEQHLNMWFLVKEMKMAIALKVEEESGLVRSDELEGRVREVMEMESGEGKALSARMMEMKEAAEAAWKEGTGPSYTAMDELAQLWKHSGALELS